MELESLRDSEEAISKFDVAYFMVSLDDADKNAKFAESLDGNFPLLSDPEKTAAEPYGVLGFAGLYTKRWTYYIDAKGVIQKIDKDVAPETAGQDIVKNLESLGF